MRWIALAVVAAVGGAMLLTWPDVQEETGPEKARSLYGFACPARCDLGPSYVAFRVNRLFQTRFEPGAWSRRRLDATPAIGAIALYGRGRVAFVEQVLTRDAIEITELSAERLTRRTVTRGRDWPRGFVLLGPRAAPEPPGPDGEVQTEDDVFVIERHAERLLDAA